MHSRQPEHFHGSTLTENRPPLPGWLFSIASKNGLVLATGNTDKAAASLPTFFLSICISGL